MSTAPLLQRIPAGERATLAFELDGRSCTALAGDTVLVAVLSQGTVLRRTEVHGAPRAGFCFMGACQDCWLWLVDGRRVRACIEPLITGMRLCTSPPADREAL